MMPRKANDHKTDVIVNVHMHAHTCKLTHYIL